jgi:hypothetical protein
MQSLDGYYVFMDEFLRIEQIINVNHGLVFDGMYIDGGLDPSGRSSSFLFRF